MKNAVSALMGCALAAILAVPVAAQADEIRTELISDVGHAITEVQAELAAIDERQSSDDWMAFESQDHGLIEVDLTDIGEWIPAVRVLRDSSAAEQVTGDTVATRIPDLWEASVLLAETPDWVFDAGDDTVIAWLRDRFGHLQTPERKAALYDAERALLLEELEALRRSQEFFQTETLQTETLQTEALQTEAPQTEEPAQTETIEIEEWCREIAIGETLMTEAGSVYLGPEIPPIEDLPDWCRDALLIRLTGSDEPVATPPPTEEVMAQEPTRCGEDVLPWEASATSAHGRWNGVWEYYGSPGLTLNQVGEFVCATYGDGDGWMKLAVVDDHTLKGRWYEGEHAAVCGEERDGTAHWGWLELHFDETFDSYEGALAVCADDPIDFIAGARVR